MTLTGSITPAGALTRLTGKTAAGAVTPSSTITKVIGKGLGGLIAPVGSLVKFIARLFGGLVTPSGTATVTNQAPQPTILAVMGQLGTAAETGILGPSLTVRAAFASTLTVTTRL
jgi:hypothetical protein